MNRRFPPPVPPLNPSALLRQYGLHPDKGLGQNFLHDPAILADIVAAAGVTRSDTVLEVGPGLGSLTRHLAAAARAVVAVELDRRLEAVLRDVLKPYSNVRLIQGDILGYTAAGLGLPPEYVVVANIPYNITSALLRHLLESDPRPRRLVLTIQKEVAARICAAPPDMSLLTLSVQVYGEPRIEARLPAAAFFPSPKVDSAVVRIDVLEQPRIPPAQLETFFRLIKAGFSQRRKTLRNSLSAGLRTSPADAEAWLRRAGIDPGRRAETLSLEEWGELCRTYGSSLGR
jgi:16S rRNA (adenine1518-N6/adenine1519-N6)-dimethyltransferase